MPRTARASIGGICYHVTNRGNNRQEVFHKDGDYRAFLQLTQEACVETPMRVLAYCLMPNHFHFVLWPHHDGDLSRWMQWLMTSHVRRYHRHYGGSGHVWQGRFKAFPIEQDDHLLTVLRYVERNALRAKLVSRAEDWFWSSARLWLPGANRGIIEVGPVQRSYDWLERVNQPATAAELQGLKRSLERGAPFGSEAWTTLIAKELGLESTLRPRGRPKKGTF